MYMCTCRWMMGTNPNPPVCFRHERALANILSPTRDPEGGIHSPREEAFPRPLPCHATLCKGWPDEIAEMQPWREWQQETNNVTAYGVYKLVGVLWGNRNEAQMKMTTYKRHTPQTWMDIAKEVHSAHVRSTYVDAEGQGCSQAPFET